MAALRPCRKPLIAAAPDDVDIYSDGALLKRLPKVSGMEAEKRAAREVVNTVIG